MPAYMLGLSRANTDGIYWGCAVADLTYTRLLTPEVSVMAKCKTPTKYGRCRKCPGCKDARLRSWQLRMILEAMLYANHEVTFVTLTYDNKHLPPDSDAAKLQLQKFFKRLRKTFNLSADIRYVAALEEGTQGTKRFHWHAILYGLPFTAANRHFLHNAWGQGFIQWKPSTPGRMGYVLKYVIKGGKFLMSRRPGIGAGMMDYINKTIEGLSEAEVQKAKFNRDMVSYFVNNKWDMEQPSQRLINYLQVGRYPFPLHEYIKRRMRRR